MGFLLKRSKNTQHKWKHRVEPGRKSPGYFEKRESSLPKGQAGILFIQSSFISE